MQKHSDEKSQKQAELQPKNIRIPQFQHYPFPFHFPPPMFYNPMYFYPPTYPGYYPTPLLEPYHLRPQIYQPVQKKTQIIKPEQTEKPPQNLKACKCLRSNCLKQYCYCFKNGQLCGQQCQCTSCKNIKPFPKTISNKKNRTKQLFKCNCTKSKCEKKYCQCYSAKRKCTDQCQCSNCHN